MTRLAFILGDQLNEVISSLTAINKKRDIVFLCEVNEEATYVQHHPKKIAFIFSAMRHFAEELKRQGYRVRYTCFNDPDNQGSLACELERAVREESVKEVLITEPGEWRVMQMFRQLKSTLGVPITICEDSRFLCGINEFKEWADGKKQLRMEYFYRKMRQKYNILLDEVGKPIGGSWNYDAENRKNANSIKSFPKRLQHPVSNMTAEVLRLVENNFSNNFGSLHPFNFAVTRQDALAELNFFVEHCLEKFGDYQDAMLFDEANLYHSRLSFYLNSGLLIPLEVCKKAELAFKNKTAPLNAVEGFIRQIIGWREYVRGIYWLFMPKYADMNFFQSKRRLPAIYWGGETKMFCMQEVVRQTAVEAYSHHIQRLMVTGNFALLAGLDPKAVCEWYLAVYADAYEWVELPNTLGMALYGDGGLVASKPYAASGKYIHRMSNFCKSCSLNPNETIGEKACPFNSLYWNFLHEHFMKLKDNQRLRYAYLTWNKMDAEKRKLILEKAKEVLAAIDSDSL